MGNQGGGEAGRSPSPRASSRGCATTALVPDKAADEVTRLLKELTDGVNLLS